MPTKVTNLSNIVSAECGFNFSMVLNVNGEVFTFGSNLDGQLGLGINKKIDKNTPILIPDLPEIFSISCGSRHAALLDINGNVYTFGCNSEGQLGLGINRNTIRPTIITFLPEIVSVICGHTDTILMDINGDYYCFGNSNFNHNNIETEKAVIVIRDLSKPIILPREYYFTMAIDADGGFYPISHDEYKKLNYEIHKVKKSPIMIANIKGVLDQKLIKNAYK